MIDDDDDNWPTSGKQFALPQRDNTDFGKSQERRMSLVGLGNYGAIRTIEWQEPDGSVSRLRTRGGWPVFEIDETPIESSILPRGFVAKVPNGRAILFDPYTLSTLRTPYLPAVNEYTVQDFKTSWNVPITDTTNWNDTILFDGQTIKVNSLSMPSLNITADHGYLAIPYAINRDDNSDQYGNSVRNETEKRVFAVGRDKVTSWGGAGTSVILEPDEPRTALLRSSITIGQRLDFSNDSAQIGQLYFPETALGWDDDETEWYFTSANVQMLLTSAYLVKTQGNANVVMSEPPINPSSSSGSMTSSETLPQAYIALIGSGEIYQSGALLRSIRWPWTGRHLSTTQGTVFASFNRSEYSGTISQDETFAGQVVSYSGQNSKFFDDRSERLELSEQTIPVADHLNTPTDMRLNANATTLYWGFDIDDQPIIYGTRAINDVYFSGGDIQNSPADRTHEEQNGSFSVSITAGILVNISFYRHSAYGEKCRAVPNSNAYAGFLTDPYGKIGVTYGMGVYSVANLQPVIYAGGDIVPVIHYYMPNPNPPPAQTPGAQVFVEQEFDRQALAISAQTLFDSQNSDGYTDGSFLYNGYIEQDVSESSETISWSTVDYILFDEINGVYISVEGSYAGSKSNGSAGSSSLSVGVRIKTRYDNNVIIIKEYSFVGSGLPNDAEIDDGVFAIKSPKVRAMFAPLHQEQGSFKGGNYVEISEESNGALPAHLFNFILRLLPYSNVGTVNENNETTNIVQFIPCNLLEMLYAVVFSHEFGVSSSRYPVTIPDAFAEVMDSLFAERFRIAVRDGVVGVWTDSFGSDFSSESEITLHRT